MRKFEIVSNMIKEMQELQNKNDYLFFDLAAETIEKVFMILIDIKNKTFGEYLSDRNVVQFLEEIDVGISDLNLVNSYAKNVRHSHEFEVRYTVAYNAIVDILNYFLRRVEINYGVEYLGRLSKVDNNIEKNDNHLMDKVTTLRMYQMYSYLKNRDKNRALYYLAIFYERLLKLFLNTSKYKSAVNAETLNQIINSEQYKEYLRNYFNEFSVPNELFYDLGELNKLRDVVRHTFNEPKKSDMNIGLLENFARVFGEYILDDFRMDLNKNINPNSKLERVIDSYKDDYLYWDFAIKELFFNELVKISSLEEVVDILNVSYGNDNFIIFKLCEQIYNKVERINV
ncbi:hypothetical protein RJG79_01055 [Mycoplasmatota bacterium WC44]